MKKLFVAVLIVATAFVSCKENKKDKVTVKKEVKITKKALKNNVDIANSIVNWKGTKPTGAHFGIVSLKSGSLEVVDNQIKSGEFLIDMTTIKNIDIKDAKDNKNIVGHLSSPDFFDVATYPTAKFVITSVNDKEGKLAVTGNLTLKEVTKSITIPATLAVNGSEITFKSESFKVDRADFGIKYKSKKFFDNLKDKFIDDLIEFSFEVKAKK